MISRPRKSDGTFEKRTPEEAIIYFWSLVDKDGPIPAHRPDLGSCWIWTGHKHSEKRPYGKIVWEGRLTYASHVAYRLTKGLILHGLELDHLCRNLPCVNPGHLEAVTHAENVLRGSHITLTGMCVRGHTVTKDSVYIDSSTGTRRCRVCHKIRQYDYEENKARPN